MGEENLTEVEEDPIFETDGMADDTYLWVWYCKSCHSTLPPFMFDRSQECPYCDKGTLQKVKVDRTFS